MQYIYFYKWINLNIEANRSLIILFNSNDLIIFFKNHKAILNFNLIIN
jgi:hypothetical protein